jgi:hypothetical protein
VFATALAEKQLAFPLLDGVDMKRLKNPSMLASLFLLYNKWVVKVFE